MTAHCVLPADFGEEDQKYVRGMVPRHVRTVPRVGCSPCRNEVDDAVAATRHATAAAALYFVAGYADEGGNLAATRRNRVAWTDLADGTGLLQRR